MDHCIEEVNNSVMESIGKAIHPDALTASYDLCRSRPFIQMHLVSEFFSDHGILAADHDSKHFSFGGFYHQSCFVVMHEETKFYDVIPNQDSFQAGMTF